MNRPIERRASEQPALRVTELSRLARELVESELADVRVEGEVSEAREASSGHLYFTLVDGASDARRPAGPPEATLRCVVFQSDRPGLRAEITVGARVRVRGRVTVYLQQSTLQLLVVDAVPAGQGERAEQRARLLAKLTEEGLLDPARKRPLPRIPRRVGLLTSKKGAAFHDVITVAKRRFPVTIVLAHVTVQGADAPRSIVAGLGELARRGELDVLIVARGGGATEDLAAFDDERVVRAIAAFPVPVVSGVGHETDVTLTDRVADRRAATPSNAAEIVVPDRHALRAELASALRRLQARFDGRLQGARHALERARGRLARRARGLRVRADELRALERRIERIERRHIELERRRLAALANRLAAADPRRRLARARTELGRQAPRMEHAVRARLAEARSEHQALTTRLDELLRARIDDEQSALALLASRLEALSPLAVLARGYAIALDAEGRAIVRAADVAAGALVEVRVHEGTLVARVEETKERS